VPITAVVLPSADTLVEMTVSDDTLCGVRVVQTDDAAVTLSLAPAAVPAVGTSVTLRWPAGPRGRYVLPCTVVSTGENRVEVRPTGEPEVEQHRNFVRGGGGEHILLRRPGHPDTLGWIRDISEQGVRAHFADVELAEGDEFKVHIQLDADVVEMAATAVKVGALRQRLPQRGPMSVEVVAVFGSDETQARVIRRYVLRQQLLTRARSVG
jgi:hypothetical protein